MPITSVRKYFQKLGLETDIADIYLALHAHGPQSMSQLSRNSGVERTKLYRLINDLLDSKLVEVDPYQKRGVLRAAPIANLSILINEKEQELKNLHDELETIEQILARNSVSGPGTRLQMFYEQEGIMQMLNALAASESEITVLLSDSLPFKSTSSFMEEWSGKIESREAPVRALTNKLGAPYANMKNWQTKSVVAADFPILQTTFMYGDTVALLHTSEEGTLVGVEHHNEAFARQQRQFFDLLWRKSETIFPV